MDTQELQRNEVTLIDDVESLIDRVRTAHREAQAQADKAKEFASKAIDRALEAGDVLVLLKPTVKHGQWEAFLAERLPEISVRQAQKYMRIARDLPLEKRTGALLTVNGALRMLEAPDDEPANEPAANDFVLPWKRSGDPVSVAAMLREYPDLRFDVITYMDADGLSIDEMAKELNLFPHEISAFFNPIVPQIKADEKLMYAMNYSANRLINLIKKQSCFHASVWCSLAEQHKIKTRIEEKYNFYNKEMYKPFKVEHTRKVDTALDIGWKLGFMALGMIDLNDLLGIVNTTMNEFIEA